jgi:hypothetical protein
MRVMKTNRNLTARTALLATALLLAATAALGESAGEGLPGDWLSRYASPRSVGRGGAGAAVPGEAQGALWNPASAAWLTQNQVQASSTQLFEGTSVNGLAFAAPSASMPSVAFNLLALKSGEFERTDELNQSLGTFDEGDLVLAVTAAQRLAGQWSVGVNAKLARQTVEEYSGSGIGFDVGVMGRLARGVTVGAAVLNVGGPSIELRQKSEEYLQELRAGLAVELFGGRAMVAGDAVHRDGPGTQARVGGEVRLDALTLRVGYHLDNLAAGFSYRFANGLQVDYGVADHELEMVHRFGLGFDFGGFYAKSQADPDVFSPSGLIPVTKFLVTTKTVASPRDWELVITNLSGRTVRTYGGQGEPPAHVVWDGRDASGLPLADGVYRYRLRVTDMDGRVVEDKEREVEIDTGGPQGTIDRQ